MYRDFQGVFRNAVGAFGVIPLVFSVLIDIVFLFVYGFVTAPVRDKIVEHAVIIGDILSRASKEFMQTRQASPGLLELLFTNVEARPFVLKLAVLLLLLLLVVYLVYCFFQGTNWKLAVDSVDGKRGGVKKSYQLFMLGFAKTNLVWFVAFGAITALQTVASLYGVVVERVLQAAPSVVIPFVLNVFFGVFVLAAFVSYAMIGASRVYRDSWRFVVSRRGLVLLVFLVLLFALIDWVLRWSGSVSSALQLLLGVGVLLPAVYFARLLVVASVRGVE